MVMVHPLHPLGLDRMGGRPELAAVAAFPLETALAAVSLMTHGVLEAISEVADLAQPWRRRAALVCCRGCGTRERSERPASIACCRAIAGEMAKRDPSRPTPSAMTAQRCDYLADTKAATEWLVAGSDYPFTIKQ